MSVRARRPRSEPNRQFGSGDWDSGVLSRAHAQLLPQKKFKLNETKKENATESGYIIRDLFKQPVQVEKFCVETVRFTALQYCLS